jgi:hypothetical protein
MRTYNLDTLIARVNDFAELVTKEAEFAGRFIAIEQYPAREVREKDEKKSAVP